MTTQQTLLHTVHAPLRRLDSDLKQHLSVTANFHIPGFRYAHIHIILHKHAMAEGIHSFVCSGAAQHRIQAPPVAV